MSDERIEKPFQLVWLHVGIVSVASFVLSLVIPRIERQLMGEDSYISSLCAFVLNLTNYLQNHLIEFIIVLGVFSIDYAICKRFLSKKGGLIWSGIILLTSVILLVSAVLIARSALAG